MRCSFVKTYNLPLTILIILAGEFKIILYRKVSNTLLKEANVIEKVKGFGAGKYKFVDNYDYIWQGIGTILQAIRKIKALSTTVFQRAQAMDGLRAATHKDVRFAALADDKKMYSLNAYYFAVIACMSTNPLPYINVFTYKKFKLSTPPSPLRVRM